MENEKTACEFTAVIGDDGMLKLRASSEECAKLAIVAAREKGLDVIHVDPAVVKDSGGE